MRASNPGARGTPSVPLAAVSFVADTTIDRQWKCPASRHPTLDSASAVALVADTMFGQLGVAMPYRVCFQRTPWRILDCAGSGPSKNHTGGWRWDRYQFGGWPRWKYGVAALILVAFDVLVCRWNAMIEMPSTATGLMPVGLASHVGVTERWQWDTRVRTGAALRIPANLARSTHARGAISRPPATPMPWVYRLESLRV